MSSRRQLLQHSAAVTGLMVAAGLWPQVARAAVNKAAFDARTLADVAKAYSAGVPVESRDVTLTAPDVAENGAAVQVTIASGLPGVRRLLLLVEKNPAPLVAMFNVTDAIEPSLAVRTKMSESSPMYAVAILADGRALFARKEVKVTLGGCAA